MDDSSVRTGRCRRAPSLVLPIPDDLTRSGRSLSIAIRVWHYPSELKPYGGIQESMQLGDASLMTKWQTHRSHELFWANTQFGIAGLVCLLAGLGSLWLFFMRPADREFLWFGRIRNAQPAAECSAFCRTILLVPGVGGAT